MDNLFIISTVTTVIYIIFKFCEMRFIKKENKPIKELAKDGLIVYICSCLGLYVINQIIPATKTILPKDTKVFTDSGSF
jgi:hypothetical protein